MLQLVLQVSLLSQLLLAMLLLAAFASANDSAGRHLLGKGSRFSLARQNNCCSLSQSSMSCIAEQLQPLALPVRLSPNGYLNTLSGPETNHMFKLDAEEVVRTPKLHDCLAWLLFLTPLALC